MASIIPVRRVYGFQDTPGSVIVVENKDKEKWEIETSADTKTKGAAVKKGDKVTIQYLMKATTVEVKPSK